jgi:flagellar protein FliO/FliZ
MTSDVTDISWLRLILAFTVTLGLLAGLSLILKYVSIKGVSLPRKAGKPRRIEIVESLAIDTKRRLVIVRCDEGEHLLLLNPQSDIVIQSNLRSKEP